MNGDRRWAGDVSRTAWLTEEIGDSRSVSDLEMLAAEARAALSRHPALPHIEAMIGAKQRLLSRVQALLDEIDQCEPGEEDRW